MRWLLRSAIAAASLGPVVPLALAQSDTPPMMPPVRELAKDEKPAGGFSTGLPAAKPVPEPTSATGTLATATQAASWVPAASGPKPAPVETVQLAVSEKPVEAKPTGAMPVDAKSVAAAPLPPLGLLAPLAPPPPTEPSTARPDYLPPAVLPKPPAKPTALPSTALPPPPSPGPLPAIPIVPPVSLAPRNATPLVPRIGPVPKSVSTAAPKPGLPAKPAKPAKSGSPVTFPVTASSGKPGAKAASPPAVVECPTKRVNNLCDPVWHLCPQDGPVRVRGWVDGGYVYNSSNPDSKFNGPYNSIDRSAEPMFHQAYVILDRPLPTNGSFGAGFRADLLYGYDHLLGQSRGFEVDRDFGQRWNGQYYGLAIPQLYGEVGNDVVALKAGHFYTPVGYEALPALGNFFYSHSYSYQFGGPFTHWGALLTTQLTRRLQVQAGAVNGWNSLVGRANNVNFLGSLKFTPDSKWWWASLALVTGDEQNNPAQLPFVLGTDGNRTRYSFLFGVTPGGPCGRWEYVFHHFNGWQENGTPQRNFARWYGIDQYLYYRASRQVRLGTRFEWFRDEDGTRVGLNRPANPNNPPLPGNYFSLTAGLNYTPTANFLVRPEVRWDFTSDTDRPAFNDGRKNNQLLVGCDLIWQF